MLKIWRLRRVKDTTFRTNVSNKMLLNAPKCQNCSFYRFWVIKGKPTRGGKIIPLPRLILFHLKLIYHQPSSLCILDIFVDSIDIKVLLQVRKLQYNLMTLQLQGGVYMEKTTSWQGEGLGWARSHLMKEFYWKIKICLYENKFSHLTRILLS